MNRLGARVFTFGGASITHIVCGIHARRRVSLSSVPDLLLASLASAAAQDPHAEIFTGLEASNNAISGYLGAGYAFGKGLYEPGWRVHGRRGGALCNDEYDAGRGGLFVKANLRNLELTLSGGFTGNYLEDEPSGYLSLAFRD